MSNKRCIPTTFYRDAQTALLSRNAVLVLLALIVSADDEGRGYAHADMLARKYQDFTPEEVEDALQEIARTGLIVLYQAERLRYYAFTDWNDFRGPGRPMRSYRPAPPQRASSDGTGTGEEARAYGF